MKFRMNTLQFGYLFFSNFIKISNKKTYAIFLKPKVKAPRNVYKEWGCYSLLLKRII